MALPLQRVRDGRGPGDGGAQRDALPRDGGNPDDAIEGMLTPFLGWFSIGLGLAEVIAPGSMARLIGAKDDGTNRAILRAFGFREIASGIGILSRPRPAGWVWSRVGGDAIDLTFLGAQFAAEGTKKNRLAAATAAVAGVAVLDVISSAELTRRAASGDADVRVRRSVTIDSTPDELYRFWRDFRNLPRFMDHLESVEVSSGGRSHWVAKAPAGMTAEWDAEITDDVPDQLIAWRSVEGSEIENAGEVRFVPAPAGRGTEVHVDLRYAPPAGAVGKLVAQLFGEEPGQQVRDDLRAFKQVIETGEIVRSDASIHKGPHPAMPPAPGEEIAGPTGDARRKVGR